MIITEEYKKRFYELSGHINEISLDDAFNKFYSDKQKHPLLGGSKEIFDKINSYLPVKPGDQFNKAYFEWVYNLIKKGDIDIENLSEVKPLLDSYDSFKRNLPQDKRNIKNFHSFSEFKEYMESLSDDDTTSKKQKQTNIKKNEVERVYEDDEYLVMIPKTQRAACLIGKGTQWCTSADEDNKFNFYSGFGDLYVVVDKNTNEKYQFHIEQKEYKDETDNDIDIMRFFKDSEENGSDLLRFFMSKEKFPLSALWHYVVYVNDADYCPEVFYDILQEVLDSNIKQGEKDSLLSHMRKSSGPELVYTGITYEYEPENITSEEIVNFLKMDYDDPDTLGRGIEHLRSIGLNVYDDYSVILDTYEKTTKNLKQIDKRLGVKYKVGGGYELVINDINVVNTKKPYLVTLYKDNISRNHGHVSIQGLNNLFGTDMLFQ